MKYKNIILILIMLWFQLSSLLIFSTAASQETIYATKDSYVSSNDPDANYGGQSDLYCGIWVPYSIYEYEVYMYFDFSSIAQGWEEVLLYLDFSLVSQTMYFDLVRITQNWNEYSITWNNKPSHGTTLVSSFGVPDDGLYYGDVSNVVSGTSFSICICSSYDQDDYVWISSREDYWENNRPRLVFDYPAPQVDLGILWGAIGGILGVLGAAAVIIVIMIYLSKKKKQLKKPSPEVKPPPQQAISSLKYCYNCGSQISFGKKYCENCGTEVIKA